MVTFKNLVFGRSLKEALSIKAAGMAVKTSYGSSIKKDLVLSLKEVGLEVAVHISNLYAVYE